MTYNDIIHSISDNIQAAIDNYDTHLRECHNDALTIGHVLDALEETRLRVETTAEVIDEENQAAIRAEFEGVE